MKRHVLSAALLALAVAAAARAEMVVEWWGQSARCRHRKLTIDLSHYGKAGMINPKMGRRDVEGIHAVRVDLSPIPRGAAIHHASLRMQAPLQRIRTDKRAYMSLGSGHWYHDPLRLYAEMPPWKPVEVYVAKPGSGPNKPVYDKARPMKLEGPQFKSFDVTAAVRDWTGGKARNLGFIVRQLDLWDWAPSATVLEVRYEGKLTDPPAQATGVTARHHKGQTFITFTEIEKIIDKSDIRWKDFETVFKKHSPRGRVFYRIYRHHKPITAGNLHRATRLDEVWPLSGFDGRMHQHRTRGEDWMGLDPEVLVPRYCIEPTPPGKLPRDGRRRKNNAAEWWAKELPPRTGLYVHQTRAAGKAYYAVTALVDGVENTRVLTAANSLAKPVVETVGPGEPLMYRWLAQDHRRGRSSQPRETQFFVYWAAPPYANQPRRPIHLTVGLAGEKPSEKVIVTYNVGDMYGSDLILGTHAHAWKGDSRIAAIVCDGCFGSSTYWSSWNTLLSREQAKNQPYGKRLADLLTPWIKKLPRRPREGGSGK